MTRLRSLLASLGPRLLATPIALALLSASVSAQEVADRWGPTPPASSFGGRFDALFQLITTLIGFSFLIVLLLLIWPVLRDRARPGHKAHFDHGNSLHDKRFTAVVSVTVFLVLDAWVLVVAMTDLRDAFWKIPPIEAAGSFPVEVLAQQWAWNFRTPGLDGEFGTPDDIVTINELTVPCSAVADEQAGVAGHEQPVILNLTSKDVIHSFFLPDMRIKRDANPGAVNVAWFEPIKAGTYDILCAELCGFAHYRMHGTLHVLEPEAYAAWEQEASRLAEAAYDENDTEARWAWSWQE